MRILFHSKMAAAALAAVCIVAANAAADAETTLLNETFDREPAGVALEDAAQSQWSAVEGQLAIGGGRALVGQALGYAKGNTWKYQIYDRPLSATLGQGEAFDLSFASAVRTTASPEFYIYAVRLYAGDDFIELSFKGGKDKPVVKAAVRAVI